jgi:hypothetical protein
MFDSKQVVEELRDRLTQLRCFSSSWRRRKHRQNMGTKTVLFKAKTACAKCSRRSNEERAPHGRARGTEYKLGLRFSCANKPKALRPRAAPLPGIFVTNRGQVRQSQYRHVETACKSIDSSSRLVGG